jgi:hypothetical protein
MQFLKNNCFQQQNKVVSNWSTSAKGWLPWGITVALCQPVDCPRGGLKFIKMDVKMKEWLTSIVEQFASFSLL